MQINFKDGVDPSAISEKTLLELLDVAQNAHATPTQSGYFVRGAGLTKSGRKVPGGNHEYSITRAVHCEESIMVEATKQSSDTLTAVAFFSKKPKDYPSPCGNCRDVLREYADPSLLIIGGNPEQANVAPFSSYLFDAFESATPTEQEEISLHQIPHTPKFCNQSIYGVVALNNAGFNHTIIGSAGFLDSCAFHPGLPIKNLLALLEFGSKESRLFNEGDAPTLIISAEGMPKVPYLERQDLLEFSRKKKKGPWKILLTDEETNKWYRTDSEQWLPHPFYVEKF